MRDEFYFPSKDGNTEIHTIEWKPEGKVRAVLQICHGMVEYIRRVCTVFVRERLLCRGK